MTLMPQPLMIVTGGSRGIGHCLVQAFLARCDVLNLSRSAATVEGKSDHHLHNLSVDLSNRDTTLAALSAWLDEHPQYRVRTLIHNAAVLNLGWLDELSADAAARTFAVNVHTPVAITTCVHRQRRFADGARVVYVVSSLGRPQASLSFAGIGLYSASKAALGRLAQVQAREFELRGVAVTVVRAHPGIVGTGMQDELRGCPQIDPAFVDKTAGLPAYEPGAWAQTPPDRDPRTISAEFSAQFIEWIALWPDADPAEEYDFYSCSVFHQQRRREGKASR